MAFQVAGVVAPATQERVGRFAADPVVLAAMRGASAGGGANFDQLLAYAAMESGLNPSAQAANSSASGLYQFTQQTWLNAVREYGPAHGLGAEAAMIVRQGGQLTVSDATARQRILDLRNDPQVSSELATDHLQGLAEKLTPVLGRAPDPAETYLAHFLGSGGAAQALQALQATPDRPAADLLPAAAQANKPMFYASDGTPMSMTQFMGHLRDRVERTYASLGATMPASVNVATNGAKSDPPEADAIGWGSNVPVHRASDQQRAMLATLAAVFTRMDHTTNRQHRQRGLPESVLAPLGAGS